MKKKCIFSTLALAAMVGACTNEEIVMVQNNVSPSDVSVLEGRTKGNLVLNAGRVGVVDNATRVDGNIYDVEGGKTAINWYWRDGNDKLGGVVVDYKNAANDIVDLGTYPNYAITNYPFAPQIDGKSAAADFSTPTAVVKGSYFFYSQYKGELTDRRVIEHEIARLQTVRDGRDAGLVQIGSNQNDGGQNFFISPIVEVAVADGSDVATPLSLTSAHAVLHITLDADLESKYIGEDGLSVHKIVLQNVGGSEFELKNRIDPADLATLQYSVYKRLYDAGNDIAKAFDATKNNGTMAVIDGSHPLAKDAQTKVLEELTRKSGDVPEIGEQGGKATPDLVYQLEEPFVYTSSDSEMELFVILPTGTYAGTDELDEYNGKTEGALRMTVYTSEGTYDCYLGSKDGLTIYRNQKVNVSRTLRIEADSTNINLFDPNDGFLIETTADYEYAIDYINDHYRDFGNSSDWKAPILNFVDNPTIEVKEGYYFPNFRTKYNGEATLKLQVAEGKAYSFDPVKTIFGTDQKPTIVIEDATSSISFTQAIPATDGTQSIELVSAGEVNVDYDITFDVLESTKALNVAKKVVVKVSDEEAVATGALNIGDEAKVNAVGKLATNSIAVGKKAALTVTEELKSAGVVTLSEEAEVTTKDYISGKGTTTLEKNSVLTVTNTFDNSANVTVKADADAILYGNSTNDATIIVEGKGELTANVFTNEKGGLVEVQEAVVETLDNAARGKATFETLNNNLAATVVAKAGSDKKGTYGALITVGNTLNNDGKISIDGELIADATVNNSGTIYLESNPYARIDFGSANLTDANGNGSLVLNAPELYEMFDSYYTLRNDLSDATGVIETTLDQDTYNKVLANYNKYQSDATQELALTVLNKITLNGKVGVVNTELSNVDFVLPTGAELVALGENLKINSLNAKGASALNTAWKVNNVIVSNNIVITKKLDVNADLTVKNNVNVVLPSKSKPQIIGSDPVAYEGVLNVNSGIFTVEKYASVHGNSEAIFYATIKTGATLDNNGVIGYYKAEEVTPEEITYWTAEELSIVNEINAAFKATRSYYIRSVVGNQVENANDAEVWKDAAKVDRLNFMAFQTWVENGCPACFASGNSTYKIYTANDNKWNVPTVSDVVAENINKSFVELTGEGYTERTTMVGWADGRVYKAEDNHVKEYTAQKVAGEELGDYIFVENNYGTFDMLDAVKTVGGIGNNDRGTKKGEFSTKVTERGQATVVATVADAAAI